jgi:MFS family permease
MSESSFRVYGYRWVVLAVFMFVNLTIQMLWIGYAPITGPAARFYGVDDLQIGLLAMSFMIAFIPLSLPVSWVIDTYGFRLAVSIGVVLMGIFGLVRGLAGANYTVVLWSTIGIAVAQPFLLNAWTKVPANWLALGERATAVVLPPLSDKQRKRRRYLLLGFTLAIPGLIGVTFATQYWLLLVSAFALGFFLVSTSPVGMQYAAEITQPTPEGTSSGLIQLFGQASVVFVYIMEAMKSADGAFTPALLFAVALMALSVLLITQLRDPAYTERIRT